VVPYLAERYAGLPADTVLTMVILRTVFLYRPSAVAVLSGLLFFVWQSLGMHGQGTTRRPRILLTVGSALVGGILSVAWSALEVLGNRFVP